MTERRVSAGEGEIERLEKGETVLASFEGHLVKWFEEEEYVVSWVTHNLSHIFDFKAILYLTGKESNGYVEVAITKLEYFATHDKRKAAIEAAKAKRSKQ